MNNIIKRKWNQNSMVIIEDLQGMAFQAESGGHTFQISGIDGEGNTVALSGTPAGVMLRADGQDVTLTCSVSGGVVSATLPANAYSVPGRFGLTIFLTSDGQKTAIYAAVGTVGKTSSGTVAPPAGSDVVDLVNAIAAAVATIPASYTDLMASMAPTYSSSGLYAVGSYAWYNGKLYRCTTAITSGETWTSGHWTLANLGSDLIDLKSALYYYKKDYEPITLTVTQNNMVTGFIPVIAGNQYKIEYKYSNTSKNILPRVVDEAGNILESYDNIIGGGSRTVAPTVSGYGFGFWCNGGAGAGTIEITLLNDIYYKQNKLEEDVEGLFDNVINSAFSYYKKDYKPVEVTITQNDMKSGYIPVIAGNDYKIEYKHTDATKNILPRVVDASGNILESYSNINAGSSRIITPTVSGYGFGFWCNGGSGAGKIEITLLNDIYYKQTQLKADAEGLSDEIENIHDIIGEELTVDLNQGYINASGNPSTEDQTFRYSDPISIKAGETLYVTTQTTLLTPSNITIISDYNSGNYGKPLVRGSETGVKTYYYTPVIDSQFVVCIYPDDNAKIYKNIAEDVQRINVQIHDISGDIEDIEESVVVFEHFYVGDGINDGTRHFNSLVDCLYAVSVIEGKKRIDIYDGTYDVLQELGGMEHIYQHNITDDTPYDADVQPWVDNCEIIGHGNVILNFMLDTDTPYNNFWLYSCLNVRGNMTIENIEIHARRCRYCIHDESGNDYPNTERHYKNVRCYMEEAGVGLGSVAVGCGFSDYTSVYIDNCFFLHGRIPQVWSCHANNDCHIVMNNTVLSGTQSDSEETMRISQNGQTIITAQINNCFITNGLKIRNESASMVVGRTQVNLVNTKLENIYNGYETVERQVVSFNTLTGEKTILVDVTN